MITLSFWDMILLIVVTAQAGLLAYLHQPRWKALILNLPFPCTLSIVSLGQPVDVTYVAGFLLLLVYTHSVRWLHIGWRVPILPAIVLAAVGYGLLSMVLVPVLPRTETAFWVGAAIVFGVALAAHRLLPPRVEPGHRTSLPVWIKLPAVAAVVLILILIKQHLQGFMALFPMVGVIASYEARTCLWTVCRQIPIIMMTLLPLVIVVHVLQPAIGLGGALGIGWAVFLAILVPLTVRQR